MPLIDQIAHGLPDEVGADGVATQPVILQHLPVLLAVVVFGVRAVDLEVVAPHGELHAVVAEFLRLLRERLDREVGPLAGEEADGTCHCSLCWEG